MTTLIVWHRCGGKSLDYPPCTLFTTKWAIEQGAQAIEYDVVLVTEKNSNERILMIEPKLVNSRGLDINNLQWEDVRDIDAGNKKFGKLQLSPIEDILSIAEGKISQQIQLKGDKNQRLIPLLLEKLKNTTNFIITAFDIEEIKKIKEINSSVRVGWLVKPVQENGGEGTVDMTALVRANPEAFPPYTNEEIDKIIKTAKDYSIDVILLCAPRLTERAIVEKVHNEGMEIGTWGVGTDLSLAKKMIALGVDRFTIDNPEQLK